MRLFLMAAAAILMVLSAWQAGTNFFSHQYFWALIMTGCWFLNFHTFTKLAKSFNER